MTAGSATATSVSVTATISNSQTNATADSGSGSTNLGVAGALAINVPGGTTRAALEAGSTVTVSGAVTGDVVVQANTTTNDTALADAKAPGFAKAD